MQDFDLYVIKGCLAMENICIYYTRKTQAHVVHSLLISEFFRKNKIDNGWLAEGEDPKKMKESLTILSQ